MNGYLGLFVACAASGIALPFPEDVAVLLAGAEAQAGAMAVLPAIAVAVAGVLVRDLIAFLVGRVVGEVLVEKRWARRLLGERRLERARQLVCSHETRSILAGRFLVGMRAPVFLVAGAFGVPIGSFVAVDLLGLAIVVPLSVALGWRFGTPMLDVVRTVASHAWLVGAAAVVGIGVAWLLGGARDDEEAVETEA